MLYVDRKELHSDLQLRDALMAKIVFHNIRTEEVTHNLEETKKEVIINLCDGTKCTYEITHLIIDWRTEQRVEECS